MAVNVTGSTSELYVGARKYFNSGQTIHPYLTGAISFITAKAKFSGGGASISTEESETGGLFGGGGLYFSLVKFF